jgi:hypothetical protein
LASDTYRRLIIWKVKVHGDLCVRQQKQLLSALPAALAVTSNAQTKPNRSKLLVKLDLCLNLKTKMFPDPPGSSWWISPWNIQQLMGTTLETSGK